jgi:Gpi18-like mannosyltransferase
MAAIPWLTSRGLALIALFSARRMIVRLSVKSAKAIAVSNGGLFSWDAGYYSQIASHGYVLRDSIRFFPLYPLLGAFGKLVLIPPNWSLLFFSNFFSLLAGFYLIFLVKRLGHDKEVAVGACWLFYLSPGAFIATMAYSDPLFEFLLVLFCIFLLDKNLIGLSVTGFFLGACRPSGIVVIVASLLMLLNREKRSRLIGAVSAVFIALGTLSFLLYSQLTRRDWLAPYSSQLSSNHRGSFDIIFFNLIAAAKGLLHDHLDAALHFPWILAALILALLGCKYLDFKIATLTLALIGSVLISNNLDGFERYATDAMPIFITGSALLQKKTWQFLAISLLSASFILYAVLGFLGIYVP